MQRYILKTRGRNPTKCSSFSLQLCQAETQSMTGLPEGAARGNLPATWGRSLVHIRVETLKKGHKKTAQMFVSTMMSCGSGGSGIVATTPAAEVQAEATGAGGRRSPMTTTATGRAKTTPPPTTTTTTTRCCSHRHHHQQQGPRKATATATAAAVTMTTTIITSAAIDFAIAQLAEPI